MSYWTDREEAARRAYQLEGDAYINAVNEIYDSMLDEIQKEINNFYAKYATSEGLTMYEAQKKVSQLDIEEYERKAKKYVETQDFSDQANKEMRLYNLTMKVNRLEMLKSNIGLEMVNSFSQVTKTVQTSLIERATEEYARQAGILGKTVQNNARSAQSLVNASFHHANWSDRIWMYQDELKAELDKLLRSGIIQGRSPLDLAQELLKLFNASKYEADRLMRTELARVQIGAEAESLIANGFEYYQFNALGTACPHCLELDEQHFKIADLMPGTNAPPMHPNCMCSISAWMDDELYNEWLESYANHGLSYEDWLAQRNVISLDDLFSGHEFKEMVGGDASGLDEAGRQKWSEIESKNITDEERDAIYDQFTGYVANPYSEIINSEMRDHPGENPSEYMSEAQLKTTTALRNVISKNTMPEDAVLTRYVDKGAAELFGLDSYHTLLEYTRGMSLEDAQNAVATDLSPLIGTKITENQFVSSSANSQVNVYQDYEIKLQLDVLKGTNAYITSNARESEVIFDSPTYEITDIGIEKGGFFNQLVITARVSP